MLCQCVDNLSNNLLQLLPTINETQINFIFTLGAITLPYHISVAQFFSFNSAPVPCKIFVHHDSFSIVSIIKEAITSRFLDQRIMLLSIKTICSSLVPLFYPLIWAPIFALPFSIIVCTTVNDTSFIFKETC